MLARNIPNTWLRLEMLAKQSYIASLTNLVWIILCGIATLGPLLCNKSTAVIPTNHFKRGDKLP